MFPISYRDVNPADQEQIKGMGHFCTIPGALYADKVIVQSENMRRVFRIFRKIGERQHCCGVRIHWFRQQ